MNEVLTLKSSLMCIFLASFAFFLLSLSFYVLKNNLRIFTIVPFAIFFSFLIWEGHFFAYYNTNVYEILMIQCSTSFICAMIFSLFLSVKNKLRFFPAFFIILGIILFINSSHDSLFMFKFKSIYINLFFILLFFIISKNFIEKKLIIASSIVLIPSIYFAHLVYPQIKQFSFFAIIPFIAGIIFGSVYRKYNTEDKGFFRRIYVINFISCFFAIISGFIFSNIKFIYPKNEVFLPLDKILTASSSYITPVFAFFYVFLITIAIYYLSYFFSGKYKERDFFVLFLFIYSILFNLVNALAIKNIETLSLFNGNKNIYYFLFYSLVFAYILFSHCRTCPKKDKNNFICCKYKIKDNLISDIEKEMIREEYI